MPARENRHVAPEAMSIIGGYRQLGEGINPKSGADGEVVGRRGRVRGEFCGIGGAGESRMFSQSEGQQRSRLSI